MVRRRSSSSPSASGLPIVIVIVGCAAFALGVLSPPSKPELATALARPAKTQVRALADGTDVGLAGGIGAWVGLNDPSIDQSAFLGGSARLTGQRFAELEHTRTAASDR